MVSNKVKVTGYKKITDTETGLCGINRVRLDGTESEVIPAVFRDVAFGCCYGKKVFAVKSAFTNPDDTFTLFDSKRDKEVEGVYDIRFLERAIWVRVKLNDKFHWQLLDKSLSPVATTPDFVFPVYDEDWFICTRVGDTVHDKVEIRGEEGKQYYLMLQTGSYEEIHWKRDVVEVKTDKPSSYSVSINKNGRITLISNLGDTKDLASSAVFTKLDGFLSDLLRVKPETEHGDTVFKDLSIELSDKLAKVLSVVKTGDDASYLVMVSVYVKAKYKLSVGTPEFLDKLYAELSSGFTTLHTYKDSNSTVEFKLFKVENVVLVLTRVVQGDYTSRLDNFIFDNIIVDDGSFKEEYCVLKPYDMKSSHLVGDDDIPVPEIVLNKIKNINTIDSDRYESKDYFDFSFTDGNATDKIRVNFYFNYIYIPREKKVGTKVYEVTTYHNVMTLA